MKTCNTKLMAALLLLIACGAAAADEAVTTIGGGVALAPRYSGSDENMVVPVVALDYSMANGFYASTLRGLGYAGARYPSAARKEDGKLPFGGKASKYLRGMGDVKGSATANLSLGYAVFDGLDVNLHTAQALSARDTGSTYGAGLSGKLFKDDANTVTLSLGFEVADKKYAQAYYGVTAKQALKSGYKVYTPKAGIYQADVTMSWQHKLDEHWGVTGMLGASSLLRDAANSPLARRTTAASCCRWFASFCSKAARAARSVIASRSNWRSGATRGWTAYAEGARPATGSSSAVSTMRVMAGAAGRTSAAATDEDEDVVGAAIGTVSASAGGVCCPGCWPAE
eukprot:gene31944-39463_t